MNNFFKQIQHIRIIMTEEAAEALWWYTAYNVYIEMYTLPPFLS